MKARLLWVLPLALIGSWLAVRTLAASTVVASPLALAAVTAPPPIAASLSPEIRDVALAKMIRRFAARTQEH